MFGTDNILIYCLIGVAIILVVVFFAAAIKIVPEYRRIVVFRLGRCIGAKGPGLVLLIPIIDRPLRLTCASRCARSPHKHPSPKITRPFRLISCGSIK